MTRLVAVELRRLAARRLVRWSLGVLLVGLLATPLVVPWAFSEQARITHDADIERCVQGRPPKTHDGVTMPTIPDDVDSPAERDRRCRQVTPTLDADFHLRQLDQVLRTTAPLLILVAFLVGASSVGADWQAGVVATVLTWETRRWRVFAARLAAVAGTMLAAVALWQLLAGLLVLPQAALGDRLDGTGAGWVRSTAGLGGRVALVAAGATSAGYALALLGRGTAAALGVGFAWLFVFENVVGSQFEPLRPWLVLWNALVFVKGTFEAGGDVPGRTVVAAAGVLAGWTAAVVVGAGVVFRRRDVA